MVSSVPKGARVCNPKNKKSTNKHYVCNTITGRWNKIKKLRSKGKCNPDLKKAKDSNYICNTKTGRWNKRARSKKKARSKMKIPIVYMAPVRNYRCSEKIKSDLVSNITKCSRNVLDLKVGDKLGSGSFGVIYKGSGIILDESGKEKNIPLAIKVIKDANLDEIYDEVEYSYYMGEVGLGPLMYDAYFYKSKTEYVQILIMEPFDMSVSDALEYETIRTQKNILRHVMDLLHKQIYEYGLECLDVKPGNFVYRKNGCVVRLIDFGRDWCTFNDKMTPHQKDMIYLMMLIQFYYLAKDYTSDTALDVFNEDSLFADRMDYIDEMDKMCETNDSIDQIYNHYLDVYDKQDLIDMLYKL